MQRQRYQLITIKQGENMSKKMFLIANPKSGRAKIKNELMNIVDIFTRGGYTVTVFPTAKRGDANFAAAGLSDEYDTVVCCGGDGTLNETINGLMQNKNRYKLGYIPAGTLNEWSSGLKISHIPKKAAADILEGEIKPLDIGVFGDRYFSYTASFGAFTSASYSAPQNVKNAIGQSAYIFEGIKSLSLIKPSYLKFTVDNKTIEGNYIFGSVSNSVSMGGVLKLDTSNIHLDDGLFEILLIEYPENLIELQEILDSIIRKTFDNPKIKFFKANKITVHGSHGTDWTLDGEHAVGQDKIEIKNIHKAIDFIVPKI